MTRKLLFPKDRTNYMIYELHDIDKYLKRTISNDIMKKKMLCKDEDDESEYPLITQAHKKK